MRSAKIAGWLLLLWVTLFASGCSYVKSLFPDKERDYQFRGEIPELIIPDDLKPQNQASKIPGPPSGAVASVPTPVAVSAPVAAPVQPVPSAPLAVANVPTVFPEANAPAPADAWPPARDEAARPAGQQPVVSNFASQPSLSAKTGVSSLKIDQSKSQAWRLVARALSRQKIEIAERNQDTGYFYVKYDPNAIKPEDNSFWDELNFMFGQDPSHEQEYRINLQEAESQVTEVTILDMDGQPLSNLIATHLLKLITDGINMELPGTPAENPAP